MAGIVNKVSGDDIGFDWFVAVKLLLVEASFFCRSHHSFRSRFP